MNMNSSHSFFNNNSKVYSDPAFQSIPKSKDSLLIWRVENMRLVPVPKDTYGTFFKGDTYLIYSSIDQHAKKLAQHIHLWIGAESTTDEQGVGAFKMIELDDFLSSMAIQHRECQGFESERFLNYFKARNGVRYQNGGASTGFHHHEKRIDARIFQLKGKRSVRLIELKNIDWTSLNRIDAFIIDLNSTIFVWNGKSANKFEKLQAIKKACEFRDERNGQCNIVVVEDGEEKDLAKDELSLFETRFPLKEKMTKLRNDSGNLQMDDMKFEREQVAYLKLYKCSDARDEEDGTVKIKIIEQKTGPLFKEDLNSEDSFIIDNGKAGTWVWIGRKSGIKERQEAMRNALGFLQAKGYDERQQNSLKITRVIDGCEPVEFKALFNRWSDFNEQKGLGKAHSINKIANTVTTNFDASLLHSNHKLAAETQMIDDGSGNRQIWVIKNFEIHEVSADNYGRFHSKNCYIIRYSYQVENVQKHILYYWIGRKSSAEDQGSAALKTIEIDNKVFDGQALQVRIVENKEPNHFMAIFGGKIVIYQNDHSLTTKNYESLNSYMLQVRAYGNMNTKAVQVEFKASSLNTSDVFVVCSKSQTFYVWCGKGSTGDERETAKSIVADLKHDPEIVIETQEKDEFWSAIGGKEAYCNEKRLVQVSNNPSTRLFEISNSSGKINVQEVYQFCQADLNSSEVMILDAWDVVFVWSGLFSHRQENDNSIKIVHDYLKLDPSQRGTDIPVFKVKQGQEPPNFTGFFGPWDPCAFKEELNLSELKLEVQSKNQPHLFLQAAKEKGRNGSNRPGIDGKNFNLVPKYSYDELTKSVEELPESVDNASREVYLNEEDFKRIFNMTFDQFVEKPSWKQIEMKRAVHLF